MNRDRLIRLAVLLDRVRAEDRNFYMGEWTCGTSACALGWAAQEPDFIAEGLFLRSQNSLPSFEEQIGMGAGAAFFGISQVESRYLFDPEYYEDDEVMWDKITPADVVDRVRALLDGEVAPMIGTAAFLNTGPDAGHVYIGDPDAHPLLPVRPIYQARVDAWIQHCFGPVIGADKMERNHRFLEEALELVQSGGCTEHEAGQLVRYVYGRPVGDLAQEVGGVMNTLAALCTAHGVDMMAAAETEMVRVWTKSDQIRAKQAAKPKHSPLPEVPGLPGAVVAILLEAHADVICSGKTWLDMSTDPTMTNRAYYRKAAVQRAARAVAITHALRDAGHHTEADALRAKGEALEEALYEVPAELEERMDLMDAALPGGRG